MFIISFFIIFPFEYTVYHQDGVWYVSVIAFL